jgi:raffinose synthase
MFHFLEKEQNVMFSYENDPILDGMDMLVRLHDGAEVQLRVKSIDKKPNHLKRLDADENYRITFAEETNKIEAYMDLAVAGDAVAAFVHASIRNKELFRDRVTFHPVDGVIIRVRELADLTGLMANYQHKDWWTRPYFQTDIRTLPVRTLSLLWRTSQSYFHMLPVCDKRFRTDLGGGKIGMTIRISAYQGGFDRCDTLAFVLGRGSDPYRLAGDNVRLALEASDSVAKPRTDKKYPEILDYLGWCSWDAFYQQVDAEGLLNKASEFEQLNIPVRWVMIDDGWSEVKDKRLRSYDAVRDKFPAGLAPVIREMKQRFGVRWVGVWHTIAGYWGGVDPEGELFDRNRSHLYHTHGDAWVPAPEAAAAFGFWNDWHANLKRQGVDFVKVDSQSAIANFFKDQVPIGEAAQAAHTALEASVGLHFNGCVINCMGMASENIWLRPASSVSRNSDDFVPQEKDGFKEHALQNAYNSFFHGHFYWGDWDMYWTDNHDDRQNMVLRAVSGGPVYFSDKLGATKAEHIWPLVYRDGKIIRCDQPAQPTEDCLTVDPRTTPIPLKLWNRLGEHGVIAAFHIHEGDGVVEGSFGPSDIAGLEGATFWVYDHFKQQLFRMNAEERMPLRLQETDAEMYMIVPERSDVTPIGLVDKLVSPDAVVACRQDNNKTVVRLKEGGRFAFAANREPTSVTVNGEMAEWVADSNQPELYVVNCQRIETETTIEILHD